MTDLPLADLDAFVAVARERSFRAAARLRGVSPSQLSEAVRRLEERLGARLLNRTTRSVTPTEAGERLIERLNPAILDIRSALEAVGETSGQPVGRLRLNVPSAVAHFILPDILDPFMELYPGIVVEITADDRFLDVLAGGFDAGIRYGERLESDMIAVPIGPREQRFITAAAPAYLARHGTPQRPGDLLAHRCIVHRFLSGAMPAWEFPEEGRMVRLQPPARFVSNLAGLEVGAAEAGHGVIRTFEEFLKPAIDAGRLVRILVTWDESFPGPYLYYASRRHVPPPLRAFVDFLRAHRRRQQRDGDVPQEDAE